MKRLEVRTCNIKDYTIVCKETDDSYCEFFTELTKLWKHKIEQGWKLYLILGDDLDSDRETWEIVWEK
ncbi:MAG: hypothetical protein IKJ03_00915 [Mycoplasmataceae bacterium]|nr:hypothetical protein [Mycoplasmataceae bacterium]